MTGKKRSTIKIRRAKPKDLEKVKEMIIKLIRFEGKLDRRFRELDKSQLMHFKKYAKQAVSGKDKCAFTLIGEANGKIGGIAFCFINERAPVYRLKKEGYIRGLFVQPTYRKKGVCKKLLKEAIKEFKKRKIKYACLNVLEKNTKALKVYKKAGFKKYEKTLRKNI